MINYRRLTKTIADIKTHISKLYNDNYSSNNYPNLQSLGSDSVVEALIGPIANQEQSEISMLAHYGFDKYGLDAHDRSVIAALIKTIYVYRKMVESGIHLDIIVKSAFNSDFFDFDYSNADVLNMITEVYNTVFGITLKFEFVKTTKGKSTISNALLINTLINGFNITRSQIVSSVVKFPYFGETINNGNAESEVYYHATNTEFYNTAIELPTGKVAFTGCKFVNCVFTGDDNCSIYLMDNDAKNKKANMFIGNRPFSKFYDRFGNLITMN